MCKVLGINRSTYYKVANKVESARMEENKLAVLVPGIGYHRDKPLLYYATKLLKNK